MSEPVADASVARPPWRWSFRFMRAWAWLAALVVGSYFLIGLADGSITAFNAALWAALLAVTAASVAGGQALYARGRPGAAVLLLAIAAVPMLLAAFFLLLVLVTQTRWN